MTVRPRSLLSKFFYIRLTPDQHRRLRHTSKRTGRFMGDIAREGLINELDRIDKERIEREERAEQRRQRRINPTWELKPPPAPPSPTAPPVSDGVDIAFLAAYVETAPNEDEAARRLARVLEMIDEAAETPEEAETMVRALEARAKSRRG